jgi:pimeloyl-ACP methyl ester carboxylesterase
VSNYVLVHGSWHGRWVWERVDELLSRSGHRVIAPDLPGRGGDSRRPSEITLEEHVDVVVAALASAADPAILVGHSFGGFVISHAAERAPQLVQLLVYVGAFLLLPGETVLGVARSVPPAIPYLDVVEDEGVVRVREEAAADVFYHDCSDEEAARATARLVPEALGPRRTPAVLSDRRFGRVPRVFVETLNDRALPISVQRRMQASLPCGEVVGVASGHSPFLSMPDVLARHLLSWSELRREHGNIDG